MPPPIVLGGAHPYPSRYRFRISSARGMGICSLIGRLSLAASDAVTATKPSSTRACCAVDLLFARSPFIALAPSSAWARIVPLQLAFITWSSEQFRGATNDSDRRRAADPRLLSACTLQVNAPRKGTSERPQRIRYYSKIGRLDPSKPNS